MKKKLLNVVARDNLVNPFILMLSGFAVIPYIQGVTEPIKKILNSHNVRVAQKPFSDFGPYFCQIKGFRVMTVISRLKEHQKAVFYCKRENSALSEHTCLTNQTVGWDNSKIILQLSPPIDVTTNAFFWKLGISTPPTLL